MLDVLLEQDWKTAFHIEQLGRLMNAGASPEEVVTTIIDDFGYRNWSLSAGGGRCALDRLIRFTRHFEGKMLDFISVAAPYFEGDNFQSIVHEDFKFTPAQLEHIELLSVSEPPPKPVVTSEPKRRIKRASIW